MSKITIKQVAMMAGVSQAAVSFVLNNKEGVSKETRKRVLEVIEKTNYRPNQNSRRLFFKKSFNISIVISKTFSPFENLFYFEITNGLLEKSKEYGYNIVFTDISMNDENVILPEIIKNNDTDGIVFFQNADRAILNEIDRLKIPYIIADAHYSMPDVTTINANYELASYSATDFLIKNGHSNIAFIGSNNIPEFYLQCFTGFKRAAEEVQLSIPSNWIQTDATDEITSYKCMEKILNSPFTPTAVFCAADIFAIGAIKCVKDKGYNVPKDISFIGIDDIVLSRYVEPKLTTVKIDKAQIGNLAMDLIIRKINSEKVQSHTIESGDIIIRDSIRKLEK